MQTVDKAMKLLGLFSPSATEIGLSELARRAHYDKAATRRFLVALAKHGLIEQNPEDRKYRLGPALLRFARVREATMPFKAIVDPVLARMADQIGETAHASLLAGDRLTTLSIVEPKRATRVFVDPSQPLPLHATASGLACLAFMDEAEAEALLSNGKLKKHTAKTLTRRSDIREELILTHRRGFGRGNKSFEDEVVGTAAAIFDGSGRPIGAVAVAAVASRLNRESEALIVPSVLEAAVRVTRAMGGEPHANILSALEERTQ
jgi:IclR family transcriptional regulator, acetate operon repressor